jgi:hypothetical protein
MFQVSSFKVYAPSFKYQVTSFKFDLSFKFHGQSSKFQYLSLISLHRFLIASGISPARGPRPPPGSPLISIGPPLVLPGALAALLAPARPQVRAGDVLLRDVRVLAAPK